MTAPDPAVLAVLETLAARFRAARQVEAEAHARVMAAHEETTSAVEAHQDAIDAARWARNELLSYSLNGGRS